MAKKRSRNGDGFISIDEGQFSGHEERAVEYQEIKHVMITKSS
jgi:hypothetical protein